MKGNYEKLRLALFASIGAVAPDIFILYSKIHIKPSLTFLTWQYAVVTAVYVGLAAIVASIFPYGKKPTNSKAFSIGFCLPIAVSIMTSFLHGYTISPRSGLIPGTIMDLMSLF